MARIRVFIVLALAVAAGGTFAYGTYQYIQSVPKNTAATSSSIPTSAVIVAANDLQIGAELKQEERRRQARLEAAAEARLDAQSSGGGGGGGGGAVPSSKYGGVVGIAMQYLGIPYQWGGESPSTGFDCSGFTYYVFSRVGVSLPRTVSVQYGVGVSVSRSQLAPGDLVFFNGLGHVGIYIGGNQFIHSPHTGDVVKISSITGYYSSNWVGARRVL